MGQLSTMQENEVHPILMTSIDWASLATIVKQETGNDVRQALLTKGIKEDSGIAIGVCEDTDDLINSYEHTNKALMHSQFGFLCKASRQTIVRLCLFPRLKVTGINDTLIILSATVLDWRDTLVSVSEHDNYDVRVIMTQCLILLERAGCRMIFNRYTRKQNNDKTITFTT